MPDDLKRTLTGLEEEAARELALEGDNLEKLRELLDSIQALERFSSQVTAASLIPGKVYELKVNVEQARTKLRLLKEQVRKLEAQFTKEVTEKPKLLNRMQRVIAQVDDAFKVLDEHRF